jgi:hypothetical protein
MNEQTGGRTDGWMWVGGWMDTRIMTDGRPDSQVNGCKMGENFVLQFRPVFVVPVADLHYSDT